MAIRWLATRPNTNPPPSSSQLIGRCERVPLKLLILSVYKSITELVSRHLYKDDRDLPVDGTLDQSLCSQRAQLIRIIRIHSILRWIELPK